MLTILHEYASNYETLNEKYLLRRLFLTPLLACNHDK